VGGPGSGRRGSLHNTFGYHRLGLKGVTKKHSFMGHKIRLGPRYPDSYVDTPRREVRPGLDTLQLRGPSGLVPMSVR
jgi:hypothetical protein